MLSWRGRTADLFEIRANASLDALPGHGPIETPSFTGDVTPEGLRLGDTPWVGESSTRRSSRSNAWSADLSVPAKPHVKGSGSRRLYVVPLTRGQSFAPASPFRHGFLDFQRLEILAAVRVAGCRGALPSSNGRATRDQCRRPVHLNRRCRPWLRYIVCCWKR
jgi:hypothetical protein